MLVGSCVIHGGLVFVFLSYVCHEKELLQLNGTHISAWRSVKLKENKYFWMYHFKRETSACLLGADPPDYWRARDCLGMENSSVMERVKGPWGLIEDAGWGWKGRNCMTSLPDWDSSEAFWLEMSRKKHKAQHRVLLLQGLYKTPGWIAGFAMLMWILMKLKSLPSFNVPVSCSEAQPWTEITHGA